MKTRILLSLSLLLSTVLMAQVPDTAVAAYVNPGTGWTSWNAAAGFGSVAGTPTAVALYCQASVGAAWQPCNPSSGGTTTNALTGAATGGAAPGSTFNGSAAVTFDYHSFGAQKALSLLAGTYVDGDMCTYTASGTLLNCNTAIPTNACTTGSGCALANGTTATTQSAGDNSTKVATTAYVASPGAITPTSVTVTGTTPGAASLVAGTGNIPALTANSAGFAAPATGGTAYLFKMPATISAGILHAAAPATGDNVNESVLTSSAVNLAADVTGQLPISAVGSAGLSASGGVSIASTGAISLSAIPIGSVGSAGLSGSGGISIASTGAMSLSGIPLSAYATQAANTVVMNATGGSAAPTAVAMPTCTTGADLYNTSTHAWSCVGTSATTLTYWGVQPAQNSIPLAGNGNANQIAATGFVPPVSVSFSAIYAIAYTADASGFYSMAITDASGNLICHPTTGIHVPATGTLFSFSCSEGTVTLTAGTTYILLDTGTASTGVIYGGSSGGGYITPYFNLSQSGCSSSSGVISGTCSISLSISYTPSTRMPGFILH